MKNIVRVGQFVNLLRENEMIGIKCYVCNRLFYIEPKYREVETLELQRKEHHVAADYTKTVVKRGLHCPYCGSVLLDKVLNKGE